ncbi:hypothetical protein GCM10027570_08690 [Streptomonospora sediminis]
MDTGLKIGTNAAAVIAGAASSVGRGLLAGLVGTAAMTVSSTIEARLSGRGPSTAPAQAAGTVMGVEPRNESGEQRFNTMVHWGYGTMWGAARGLIGDAGLHGPAAAAAHLALVWGGEQAALPATGVSSPAWQWGPRQIAIDLLHHSVYAAATGCAYDLLGCARDRAPRGG